MTLNFPRTLFGAVLLVNAVLLLTPSAFGQVGGGGVTGVVTDVTGGVMPGVEVSVRNESTNVARTAITNDRGVYRVTNLISGLYSVRFELTGFKRLETAHNQVTVGTTITVNATLELGDITETLTITSLSADVNVTDSQPSTLIGGDQIIELPLNGRNVYALALVSPGVVPAMGSVAQTGTDDFMSAGSRARGNAFTLDGAHNTNDGISGDVVVQPSVDSVQEFRLIRNNFSAEYGTHSGSVLNVVTKSGTNEFHGSAYWFRRSDAFDAANVFATYDPDTGEKDKSPLKQNQFGFTFGGPIIKDSVFFFGGYEGQYARYGSNFLETVETPEFRQYLAANFPDSPATEVLNDYPAATPTENINTVQDLIDSGAFLCFFCDPSQWPADLPVNGDVSRSGKDIQDQDQFYIRIDANLSEKTQLFGRFDDTKQDATYPSSTSFARPGFARIDEFNARLLSLSLTHSFTPTTLNELRFSYTKRMLNILAENAYVPWTAITGAAGADGVGTTYSFPQAFTNTAFQIGDIVSFNMGDHFLRAGFDWRKPQDDGDFGFASRPGFWYRSLFDYALDEPYYNYARFNPTNGAIDSTPRVFQTQEFGWFIQDDWKVNPRLTLNLGLRWDHFAPVTEKNNQLSNIRFPTGDDYWNRVATATVGQVDQLYDRDMNNFAPRLGFAWDLFGDNTTALRGGYGVSYEKIFFNVGSNSRFNPPFSATGVYSSVFFGDDVHIPRLGPDPSDEVFGGFVGLQLFDTLEFDQYGGVVGQRLSLRVVDPKIRDSYVHSMFLGVQRELPWEMVFEFNLQGTLGKKLSFIGDPNRFAGDLLGWADPLGQSEGDTGLNFVHPSWSEFNLRQNRITSNYYGFNMQLQKRMTSGLSFQAAYTFGKSLDYNSDVFGSGSNDGGSDIKFSDPLNIALDYGRSNFDIRQRFVANFIWEVPYRRDGEGVLGAILGGWQLTSAIPIQTGLPFSVYHTGSFPSGDYNADGLANDRPDTPSFGNTLPTSPGTSEYIAGVLEREDFEAPTEEGTTGNLGKNTYQGQNYWSVDLGLFKNFMLGFREGARIQFRAEFFNLFNRVNLELPVPSLNSSRFGKSTQSFDPRQIQFALKFMF